ncbi:MAG: glycine zipper domain-containing protein [Syntrophales bacterium]|nr:glycine zipper domain-containing protein [Syntrophales bacterium]MCU0584384.1 glycine zipper domain-containing protein [Syntrophales bacterium]
MNTAKTFSSLFALLFLLGISTAAIAQQYVFPQKGQSADQQKKDDYECHSWAVKQTGFDPTQAAQAPQQQAAQQPAGAQPGSGARGAARGAVAGAAIGSLDGEAGKGAAVGATAGAVAARGQSRKQAQQQQAQAQQQASSQQSAKQQNYLKAKAACLEGKGYSVK